MSQLKSDLSSLNKGFMNISCLGQNEGFQTTLVEEKTSKVSAIFLSIIPEHGLTCFTERLKPIPYNLLICKYLFCSFTYETVSRQHKLSGGKFVSDLLFLSHSEFLL